MSLNSFVCTQLNGFKYCYPTHTILFNINHLFLHTVESSKGFQVSLSNIDNFYSHRYLTIVILFIKYFDLT